MKRTLKNQAEYLKNTAHKFAVYSFVNGRRESGYIGIGVIDAFEEAARNTARGKNIVITLQESDKEIMRYEIENKCHAPYEFVLEFAVVPKWTGEWCVLENHAL